MACGTDKVKRLEGLHDLVEVVAVLVTALASTSCPVAQLQLQVLVGIHGQQLFRPSIRLPMCT